jgi:hypothetical protein
MDYCLQQLFESQYYTNRCRANATAQQVSMLLFSDFYFFVNKSSLLKDDEGSVCWLNESVVKISSMMRIMSLVHTFYFLRVMKK